MSKFPVYKLVWAFISNVEDHENEHGLRDLILTLEKERKDAYTAAFTLAYMMWRADEESFNNNYSVWIARYTYFLELISIYMPLGPCISAEARLVSGSIYFLQSAERSDVEMEIALLYRSIRYV
eukprot:1392443-Amorphochlora_amoeboformis.AAC.1